MPVHPTGSPQWARYGPAESRLPRCVPEPSLRLVADVFRFCAAEVPSWNPISISGYHIREAGATAVQELAFTLSNTIEYVKRAIAAGLAIDLFAPRLSFFFAAHNDLLEEIAKFRAARRMYARIMRERFNAAESSCRHDDEDVYGRMRVPH